MKSILRFTLVTVLLFMLFISSASGAPERRSALVIGNSSYSTGSLRNPANDADDMASALKRLGFDVILKKNTSQQDMEDAIRNFGDRLKRGGVGLFFYAGHGVQIAGKNFLLPIGARIDREIDVKYRAVDADMVLDEMGNAGNPMNIVILDACRDNPFGKSFRTTSRGLAIISSAPRGTLISYSTNPGNVAADGSGHNSPYTGSLIKHMMTPGLPIEEVFKNVRQDLGRQTEGKQIPWELSSLEGKFYFMPGSTEIVVDNSETKEALEKQPQKEESERQDVQIQTSEPSSFADLKKKMEAKREKESQWVKDFEDAKKMEADSSDMPEKIQVWRTFIANLTDERTTKIDEIRKYASYRIERLEHWKTTGKKTAPKEIKYDVRFIAYDDGTVLDTETNLMWAAKDNGADIDWYHAKNYCERYRGGGYTDWRIPTIDELAGLYDTSKAYRSTCGYDEHLTELIRLTCNVPWGSETHGSDAVGFVFPDGKRSWSTQSATIYHRALPVRSAK